MKEQFVTYEIALKLKELGFNEECFAIYINLVLKPVIQKPISGEFNYKFKSVRNSVIVNSENCSAPLWQQTIDWLRKEHCICVSQTPSYVVSSWFVVNEHSETKGSYPIEQAILKAIELIK